MRLEVNTIGYKWETVVVIGSGRYTWFENLIKILKMQLYMIPIQTIVLNEAYLT